MTRKQRLVYNTYRGGRKHSCSSLQHRVSEKEKVLLLLPPPCRQLTSLKRRQIEGSEVVELINTVNETNRKQGGTW